MRRLIESGIDFLVESGFLYLPLLFDPAIEREIQVTPDGSRPKQERGSLIQLDGKHFVRTISLPSLADNCEPVKEHCSPENFRRVRWG